MATKKKKSTRKRKKKKGLSPFFYLLLVAGIIIALYRWLNKQEARYDNFTPAEIQTLKLTNTNYQRQVRKAAKEFGLPEEYFLALIVLECSGRKNPPSRFEKHIYKRLKNLKSGRMKKYENLRPHHLKDASDGALKNLASSWGPFQVMGYKCILLNIKVKDLRGKNTVYWGINWINLTYGKCLRNDEFKHAFHIHNTGRRYPRFGGSRTHDPLYVEKGLKYMEFFRME